jgi:hypothetical protein
MAKLKDIKGSAIQYLAEDPVEYVGSWSSGGNLNTARYALGGAGLTPQAAIVFGGVADSPPSLAITESYNGTSWTEVNDMPQVTQFVAGVGTSTAAVAIAGVGGPSAPPKGDYVQEWNGSAWSTNPNAYPFAGYSLAGAGTATASIISGGDPARTDVNTFDGTSFTSSTAMNTGRRGHGSVGTTTANLVVGGETPRTANTEIWNGSAWTEVNDYPAATQDLSAWGTSTSALGAAGYDTAASANSASWDGTSWTETADLTNARNGSQTGGIGSDNTEGLIAGGDSSGKVTFTEEWGFPPSTSTILQEGQLWFNYTSSALKGYGTAAGIPAGTWSAGGSLNTGREAGGGAGTQTAALVISGTSGAEVESYDGSSFTEITDINTSRRNSGSAGTQTAALYFAGETPSPTDVGNTESWNGSSWTEVNDVNTARQSATRGIIGTQGSALLGGGHPQKTQVESWDGTSWTEVAELNTARGLMGGGGSSNSNVIQAGGYTTTNVAVAETWDGSSWTEVNDLNTARRNSGGGGSIPTAIVFGGYTTTNSANTESWNGTSWSEVNDLSIARNTTQAAGNSVAGLAAGGSTGPNAVSEEFTASAVVSTVTTS